MANLLYCLITNFPLCREMVPELILASIWLSTWNVVPALTTHLELLDYQSSKSEEDGTICSDKDINFTEALHSSFLIS